MVSHTQAGSRSTGSGEIRERKSDRSSKIPRASTSKESIKKSTKEKKNQQKEVREDGDGILGPDETTDKNLVEDESTEQSGQSKLKKRKPAKKDAKDGELQPSQRSFLSSFCSKAKYVILLVFIPPFLNYASLQREGVELKPEGELYDIGWGQKLFLSCKGKGSPTVVLDAPTGMSSDVWTVVADKLREHATVCVYDRAGIGFSERPFNRSQSISEEGESKTLNQPEDRRVLFTAERMVDDLHLLITSSSQQPRPLILVGAELGAIVSQFYAHMFESDVLGLVLVNPLPDELFQISEGIWSQHWFTNLGPTYQTLQLAAALGFTRLGLLLGALKQPITGQLVSQEVEMRQKYLLCHPRHLSSVVDEHHFINETLSQLKTLRLIKQLPSNISVSILTGNYYDEQMPSHLNKAWARAEQSLLSRHYSTAQHLVINGADRHMMYRKPEPIIETVVKLIRRWKRSQESQGVQGSKAS